MTSRSGVGLACALGVCATALVLGQSNRPIWSYASSDHFEAYVIGDERRAREVIADFERVHPTFAHLLELPDRFPRRPRVIVFNTAAQFAPYGANDISNAFWLGTPDGDFIVVHSLNANSRQDVVHEYAHLMLNRAGFDYPLWLNEGLAEYYSTMVAAGSQMRIGLAPSGAMETVSRGPLLTLDRLFAVDAQSSIYNDRRSAPLFYAQSWGVTHMLLNHERYRAEAGAVLEAITLGTSAADAVSRTYSEPLTAIDADLRRYLVRFRLPSSLIDVPGLVHDTSLASARADDIDVEVTLASLLGWRPGREEQGRAAMVALEERAPQDLMLTEARGLLEIYTKHCDAARAYLEKAVALGSANAAVLRAYATIVGTADSAQEESLLDRAETIAPKELSGSADLPLIPCGTN